MTTPVSSHKRLVYRNPNGRTSRIRTRTATAKAPNGASPEIRKFTCPRAMGKSSDTKYAATPPTRYRKTAVAAATPSSSQPGRAGPLSTPKCSTTLMGRSISYAPRAYSSFVAPWRCLNNISFFRRSRLPYITGYIRRGAVDGLVHVDHVVRVDESVSLVVFRSCAPPWLRDRGTPRPGCQDSVCTTRTSLALWITSIGCGSGRPS